ncbi:AraC family transcriptional regulator [Muricomes intestini]|jgi:AraC-like DNA-binding protein|uniref:AraC-like DNA-binding protein n=1 Tax=Muricomes intestini TaxID=1796634 RepID=A0A4R3K3P1_9FIRM|nr:AraC family transcriptional regulator [Muricomes intestini]TCS77306.1 AraC-like DNA-binding protein [Muricomes intestini]HAX53410.1 AraC family transcriptional regulator [Lachnospiraceae bacterium]HCR83596.1 AraC family transcriptional regulator [Lachnospiraceae bacterium]
MPIFFNPFPHDAPLTVESIGNNWTQEPVHRREGFPYYHWLQTESGCGEILVENKKMELKKGDGILLSPCIPHSYVKKEGQWQTSFVTFCGSLAPHINEIIGNAPYILVISPQAHYYNKWISRLIHSFQEQQLTAAALSTECYNFLLHFSQIYQAGDLQVQPLYKRYVAPVIKKIEENYDEQVTTEDLAAAVYISSQYLNRLFQRFTGCSVYVYLTNYRMNKAKELLMNHLNLEIQQVHYRVGYTNISHFIASFKKHTGYTPLEFRKIYGIPGI